MRVKHDLLKKVLLEKKFFRKPEVFSLDILNFCSIGFNLSQILDYTKLKDMLREKYFNIYY